MASNQQTQSSSTSAPKKHYRFYWENYSNKYDGILSNIKI